jgi:hypothetical protein
MESSIWTLIRVNDEAGKLRSVQLAIPAWVIAAFAAAGSFGTFVLNLGRTAGWWH